jgi:aspartate ammonia-lyase
MGAFAEAFGRDRWRVYKCEERLRVVNLGGTAIGTGLGAPRRYIFSVTEKLKAITGFGLARAENLVDNTQNMDVFVEVSGILSACATNLLKTATDLRLLASGPDAGLGEIQLPALQAGSSIMPGKVNPVIPEAVSQAALCVMSNHTTIAQASAMGNLELNAFVPLIADRLLDSLRLLSNAGTLLNEKCVRGIRVNERRCRSHVHGATATMTALIDAIGYKTAESLLCESEQTHQSLRDLVLQKGLLTAEAFDEMISAEAVTRLGSRKEIE